MQSTLTLLASLLVLSVDARPLHATDTAPQTGLLGAFASALAAPGELLCPRVATDMFLPANQTPVTLKDGEAPTFVAVGRGIQNYTCSAAGTWKSVGAVAQLFDIGCIVPTPAFNTITSLAYDTPLDPLDATLDLSSIGAYLGIHTFVSNNGTLLPRFDFSTSQGGSAFVVANKTGTLPSPDDRVQDVAWLELANLDGTLASTVYRVATYNGTPPPRCGTVYDGATLSMPYAAQYWFFT